MNAMSFGSRQVAQAEMEPGEYLLWCGQPDPKRWVPSTIPVVLFGIPWTAFSLFWMGAASGIFSDDGLGWFSLFALFGVPFVAVGLGMLAAPCWAYMKARRTTYAITDRRIIVIASGKSKTVQSYSREDVGEITRVERPNGTGDVVFGPPAERKGLFGIPDARRVESLLRDTFKRSAGEQASLPDFRA